MSDNGGWGKAVVVDVLSPNHIWCVDSRAGRNPGRTMLAKWMAVPAPREGL